MFPLLIDRHAVQQADDHGRRHSDTPCDCALQLGLRKAGIGFLNSDRKIHCTPLVSRPYPCLDPQVSGVASVLG